MKKTPLLSLVLLLFLFPVGMAPAQDMLQPSSDVKTNIVNKKDDGSAQQTAGNTAAPGNTSSTMESTSQNADLPDEIIKKRVGEEHLIPLKGISRISVSNPAVMTANVVPEGVLVTVKGVGVSDLRVFMPDGTVRYYCPESEIRSHIERTFSRISSAVATQTKGLGFSFLASM